MLISQSILSFSLPKMTTTHQSFPNFFKASTTLQSPKEVKEPKNKLSCASSLSREKVEIFKSMDEWASEGILPLLKPVEKSWQPDELLPDSNSEEFIEQINELRERSKEIPDDCLVALVGNMITEEALPSYQTRINCTEVYRDETGIDNSPWAVWTRGWTAEENRHGDLLNKYLYLSGRIDMKQVEKTIQYLVASGIDIGTGGNPYHLTIYTSFQERATFISHGNTARLALKHGDTKLAQICGTIAADEKRHETAYSRIVAKLFELVPIGAVEAFADMLKIKVGMPGLF